MIWQLDYLKKEILVVQSHKDRENREKRSQDMMIHGINFEEYPSPRGDNEETLIQANQFYQATGQNYRGHGRGGFGRGQTQQGNYRGGNGQ